ncbi:MAG: hypothetical protein Q9190_006581 [Brigantiaea leucoxantha]
MSTVTEVQNLLRFLSQDAKVPVPLAMSKVKELQAANLTALDDTAAPLYLKGAYNLTQIPSSTPTAHPLSWHSVFN